MDLLLKLIGVLAVWVLLPLIPAILLFRLLPNDKLTVNGPFNNFTVNASGGVGAYVLIFATITVFISDLKKILTPVPQQYWTLHGDVELIKTDGERVPIRVYSGKIKVVTEPDMGQVNPAAGSLLVKLVEGESGLPAVRINVDSFGEKILVIKKGAPDFTFEGNNVIRIKQPLQIHQDPRSVGLQGDSDVRRPGQDPRSVGLQGDNDLRRPWPGQAEYSQ
jgi:hypothetical protein